MLTELHKTLGDFSPGSRCAGLQEIIVPFKKAYDMSPIDYLIYCRITYATEYLLKSERSVAEIAQLVGYDNPTHFTNMFVKRIGCTPTEYREKNLNIPVDH